MSRGQEGQVVSTAKDQNKTDFSNAQNSYNQANNSLNSEQGDIQDYKNQLSQYAAANPYGQGGAYQTAVNQSTANTADAASQATAQKMAGAAARTGQNAGQAVAGGQAAEQANTRDLMQTQAQNNASRISNQASYNKGVLSASEVPATLQEGVTKGYSGLTSSQNTAANEELGTEQKAAETPTWGEDLYSGTLKAGEAFAEGYGKSKCWIAAELYGGWFDPRTVLVRAWLDQSFKKRWYGPMILAAYGKWGPQVAKALKTHKIWRRFFQWIFDGALVRAEIWLATVDGRKGVAAFRKTEQGVL